MAKFEVDNPIDSRYVDLLKAMSPEGREQNLRWFYAQRGLKPHRRLDSIMDRHRPETISAPATLTPVVKKTLEAVAVQTSSPSLTTAVSQEITSNTAPTKGTET